MIALDSIKLLVTIFLSNILTSFKYEYTHIYVYSYTYINVGIPPFLKTLRKQFVSMQSAESLEKQIGLGET